MSRSHRHFLPSRAAISRIPVIGHLIFIKGPPIGYNRGELNGCFETSCAVAGNVLIPIGNFRQCVPFGLARMFNASYIVNLKLSIAGIYGPAASRKMESIDFFAEIG